MGSGRKRKGIENKCVRFNVFLLVVIIERVKIIIVLGCIVMFYFVKFKIFEIKFIVIDSVFIISKVLFKFLIFNVF